MGLGNVGNEYANTRHNVGFQLLDALVDDYNTANPDKKIGWEEGRHAFVSRMRYKGKQLFLIKPTTFMNLSGKAVNYWLQKEKIPQENLLVITDDIALPFGTLRMRAKGGAGGHNGLDHINQALGATSYTRLRFGVGDDFPKGAQVDYVLSDWKPEEKSQLAKRFDLAGDIIRSFCFVGVDRTMSEFNNK